MAGVLSFDSIDPRMHQTGWRTAMLNELPGKWSKLVSKRLTALDVDHRYWLHGNTYLREHVAAYAANDFQLTATLDDIRECAKTRALEAYGIV